MIEAIEAEAPVGVDVGGEIDAVVGVTDVVATDAVATDVVAIVVENVA